MEETEDGERTRECHTRRVVEEGTGRRGDMLIVPKKKRAPACRSMYWASEGRRDEMCVTREAVRDELGAVHGVQREELSTIREGQRDGLRNISEVREDGLDQKPKRKTCKRQEKTDEVTCASRNNKFDVLNLTERGLEVLNCRGARVGGDHCPSGVAKSARRRRRWSVRQQAVVRYRWKET